MDLCTAYINSQCVGFCQRSLDRERTKVIPAEQHLTELFDRMGFLYKEYLNYLPGHNSKEEVYIDWDGDYICWFGEDEFSRAMTHSLRIDFETIEIEPLMDSWNLTSPLATFRRWVDETLNETGMWLFLMQPTMQNVIDGWDYTEYPTHDDMWFCSDWKG